MKFHPHAAAAVALDLVRVSWSKSVIVLGLLTTCYETEEAGLGEIRRQVWGGGGRYGTYIRLLLLGWGARNSGDERWWAMMSDEGENGGKRRSERYLRKFKIKIWNWKRYLTVWCWEKRYLTSFTARTRTRPSQRLSDFHAPPRLPLTMTMSMSRKR